MTIDLRRYGPRVYFPQEMFWTKYEGIRPVETHFSKFQPWNRQFKRIMWIWIGFVWRRWYQVPLNFVHQLQIWEEDNVTSSQVGREIYFSWQRIQEWQQNMSTYTRHTFLLTKYKLFQCDYIRGSCHHLEKGLLRLPKDIIIPLETSFRPTLLGKPCAANNCKRFTRSCSKCLLYIGILVELDGIWIGYYFILFGYKNLDRWLPVHSTQIILNSVWCVAVVISRWRKAKIDPSID
jgi:hypothetical protein